MDLLRAFLVPLPRTWGRGECERQSDFSSYDYYRLSEYLVADQIDVPASQSSSLMGSHALNFGLPTMLLADIAAKPSAQADLAH